MFIGKHNHRTNIKERLEFLKFLAKESTNYKITKSIVNEIWTILIDESSLPSLDGEAFFKWLVESCDNEEE